MNWGQWAGHIVLAVSALLALAVLLGFKLWHHARQRRAPLAGRSSVGHLPGRQVLERLRKHDDEIGRALFLMMLALPLIFMVWAARRVQWDQVRWGGGEWVFAFGALIVFAWGFRDYVRHYKAREQAQDGWIAEQVTGQQLNRLIADGCHVLHDLPADVGNVDHVVIGPYAVYAVETKSVRKPKKAVGDAKQPHHEVHYDGRQLCFPDFTTARPLRQAMRQAQWLRRTLRDALDRDVPVIPILALPGWYVAQTEEGKRADVRVFTPMGRGAGFMAGGQQRLSDEQRRVIAQTLAARYPAIAE